MGQVIGFVVVAGIFVVPILLLILFVNMRAKARREMLQGPWSQLAAQYGGQLMGDRIFVNRGGYQMTLEMQLVSVLQAAGTPWFNDGGTFTIARLAFDPNGPNRVATVDRAPLKLTPDQVNRVMSSDNALAHAGADAFVFLGATDARVVFPGAMGDAAALSSTFAGLERLAQQVSQQGPITIATKPGRSRGDYLVLAA